jgi:hypothetical protein
MVSLPGEGGNLIEWPFVISSWSEIVGDADDVRHVATPETNVAIDCRAQVGCLESSGNREDSR